MRRFVVGVGLTLVAVSAPRPVRAQSQAAPAESLFEEGRALLADKKYPEACSKFAESEKLDPAVGTLLNLGDCYEKMGRIATAWAIFKQAATMARTARQQNRERIATTRVAALEPNIPRLAIHVQRPVAGLEVRRDGIVLGEAEWSGPSPSAVTLDPGIHEVSVRAPGRKGWTSEVTLGADGQTKTVEVPELEVDDLAERAPIKPPDAALTLEAVNTHDRNVQRAIGIAIGGVGVATMLVGIPFGARALSLNGSAAGECPTNTTCTSQGQSDAQSAVSNALVSTLLLSIGAGVTIGGAIVFLTAPAPKKESAPVPKAAWRFEPQAGPGLTGLRLSGSF